ncbi:unnamed protein product [Symbiodinium sp. KB8]|nr:unnamed protein product [Symbiodinium sp. KB8]
MSRKIFWKMTTSPPSCMATCQMRPKGTRRRCRTAAAWIMWDCSTRDLLMKTGSSSGTSLPATVMPVMAGTRPNFPSTSPLSRRPSMPRKIFWKMTTSPPSWMATCQMRSSPQSVCEASVNHGGTEVVQPGSRAVTFSLL